MKTLTKILLLSLVCANFAHAGGTSLKQKLETGKQFFGSTLAPQPAFGKTALCLPTLVLCSAFVKASTTGLARQKDNSMLLVGKNALKSLGGSLLASVLLWISNPDRFGVFGALDGLKIWQNNILNRSKRGTTTVSTALKVAALISYLAGQNNWDPRTGLTPKGIKELFTKKYTTTEQIEFVVNTFLPLIVSNWMAGTYYGEHRQLNDWSSDDGFGDADRDSHYKVPVMVRPVHMHGGASASSHGQTSFGQGDKYTSTLRSRLSDQHSAV